MTSIQVVPDTPYMIWQLRVQMLNFRDYHIEEDAVILVALNLDGVPSKEMKGFEEWTKAKVYYYPDTRVTKHYISSIRPHILAKHFRAVEPPPVFFYHDQDIIFNRTPDLEPLTVGDTCYVAEAAMSYLYTPYLLGFKKYIFYSMCEICEIDPMLVQQSDPGCGGAQYVMKNITAEFWEWAELKCEQLYFYLQEITTKGLRQFVPTEDLPSYHIQIWAADMWVIFWGMLRNKQKVEHAEAIDFSWPYLPKQGCKAITHNAGIDGSNEMERLYRVSYQGADIASGVPHHEATELARGKEGAELIEIEGRRKYFNKCHYFGGTYPFGQDHSYVDESLCQHWYVELINRLQDLGSTPVVKKPRVLAVFCTTNNINPDLLALVIERLKIARDKTTKADVQVVTCSWKPIPNNPFTQVVTPFTYGMGHLNYILQIKQVLNNYEGDIVSICEHDMVYPPDYFDQVVSNWDYSKYGVTYDNYIGINETGWLQVTERHQPMSLMSFAKFYIQKQLDLKLNECLTRIAPGAPHGWACVEPDNKEDFKRLGFTDQWPAFHVNMNHLGSYGSAEKGTNHHFTTHCEVCYAPESYGQVEHPSWGHYRQYFTFDLQKPKETGQGLRQPLRLAEAELNY